MAPKNKKKPVAKKPAAKPVAKPVKAAAPAVARKGSPRWLERLPAVFMALAAILAIAAAVVYLAVVRPAMVQRQADAMPPIGAVFSMIDDHGLPVSEKTLANGKDYHVVFFGYTNCPDICPTTLNQLAQAMQKLPAQTQDRVKVVLVSVDPKRDTPERLREYLDGFDKRFMGWTGPKEEIDRMTKGYMAFYSIEEPAHEHEHEHADEDADDIDAHEHEAEAPVVNHSSVIYLMGPDGKYVTHMSNEDGADGIAARLAEFVR